MRAIIAIIMLCLVFIGIGAIRDALPPPGNAAVNAHPALGPVVSNIVEAVHKEAVPTKSATLSISSIPGRARLCLFNQEEFHIKPTDSIVLPATTVFEDSGANEGKPNDFSTWRHETKPGDIYHAAFLTTASVTLKLNAPCAEVDVKMFVGPMYSATSAKSSDNHLFRISDVVEYPIPRTRPAIELGKLIDDIDVYAVLTNEVSQSFNLPVAKSESERSATCLAGATKPAGHVGAGLGPQGSINVSLGHPAAHEMSYTCSSTSSDIPGVFIAWDGSARPPRATLALIANAGEFVTGASKSEILAETNACVAAAMRPDSGESANREFRGVKIECTAFARDGGAGTVDVYRRFGVPPKQPEPTAQARQAMEKATRTFAAERDAEKERTKRFVDWYQDTSVPKNVKIFAMMASRITALGERCPSAKSHAALLEAWANSTGVSTTDIQPGGRYAQLITAMLIAARSDVAKTSVANACAAAAKYDALPQ